MHYLSARFAVLAAAMTFSLAPLGQAATASGDKPVPWSMNDRNSILPPSSDFQNVVPVNLVRYTAEIVEINLEWMPTLCIENSPGAWTVTAGPTYGKATIGTEFIQAPDGECPGKFFTFATISYEWTARNNKTISDTIDDTFNADWKSPDGIFDIHFTFNINVPVVRPDHEETAFMGWFDPSSGAGPIGIWKQTLVGPPDTDPDFDFSGEIVQEFPAAPAGPDTCWDPKSRFDPLVAVTNQPDKPNQFATVESGNTYPDIVGYSPMQVSCYRQHSNFLKIFKNCGTNFGQLMGIHAPSDGPPFNPPKTWTYYGKKNTGNVNALGASMTQETVTSIRAGKPMTFPAGGVGVCPF
ncbi:MAG: hypothetical protein ACREDT_11330 [Methylocella sp.]